MASTVSLDSPLTCSAVRLPLRLVPTDAQGNVAYECCSGADVGCLGRNGKVGSLSTGSSGGGSSRRRVNGRRTVRQQAMGLASMYQFWKIIDYLTVT